MSTPTPYLDPFNQATADELATQTPLADLTIPQFRALLEQVQQHEPIPGVTRTTFTVPFQDGVKCFVFNRTGVEGYLPVIFYFHGGAWVGGK